MQNTVDGGVVNFRPLRVRKWALEEAADKLLQRAVRGDGALVLTHNLDHIRLARVDTDLAAGMNAAEVTLADGVPLLWLASLAGDPLPGRVNGTDLMEQLCAKSAGADVNVTLVGGRNQLAEEAAMTLRASHPGLRIVEAFSPSNELSNDPAEIDATVARITATGSNIVFIGLPAGLQVEIGRRLRSKLPSAVVVGVGASFSFVSGEIRRAPVWAQRAGLEWFFRLVAEPQQLARRYLIEDLPVLLSLGVSTINQRVRGIVAATR